MSTLFLKLPRSGLLEPMNGQVFFKAALRLLRKTVIQKRSLSQMDIEKKTIVASRVLFWIMLIWIVIMDLVASAGLLWLPYGIFLVPVFLIVHGIIQFRQREDIWKFIAWGLTPPLVIIGIVAFLVICNGYARMAA